MQKFRPLTLLEKAYPKEIVSSHYQIVHVPRSSIVEILGGGTGTEHQDEFPLLYCKIDNKNFLLAVATYEA